ncbi:MAG TPA: peptide ABC transporter substrate-binding protein [Phycisphaerae bacterium]|nr:peptide ABC transporter substrate-binding protein [Phycisphaerae bacterium]
MFRWVVAVCLILLAATLAGYTLAGGSERADFAYVNSTGINTLDPAQMSWTPDIRVAINIWEGLTTYDPRTTRPREGAAYLPPDVSADHLTYTFTLRPDARWSNGDPVTSGDFVRAWRRAIEPGTAGDYAFFITDYIAGAGEYYEWRNHNVAALTALNRLARGWGVDDESARSLWGDAELPELAAARPGPEPPTVAEITSLDLDWGAIYRRRFERHAAELDARFVSVGLEAPNDHTLRVMLTRPCPYFLDLCAFAVMLPCHRSIELLREGVGDTGLTPEGLVVYDPQWTKPDYHANGYPGLITNGPYRVADWAFKRRLHLETNPHYWDRESIACRSIDMLVYSDLNTALMAYERGDVDFLPDMSVEYDHQLVELAVTGQRPDFIFPVVFGTYYYIFNCDSETVRGRANPFRDARVRKAFALCIDKRTLTDKVIGRGDPVSQHVIPVGTITGYESPPVAAGDAGEARRLLADAGYAGGRDLPPIDLLYSTGSQHGKVCEYLANTWRLELGVTVELRGKETKTFAEDKVKCNYMIARAGWYGDYADPTTFLDVFATGNGNNDAGYSNPTYDALLARAAAETDAARRMQLLADAEAMLVNDEFPALPLWQYTNLMAVKSHVRGLHPNPRLTFPFRYLSVQR